MARLSKQHWLEEGFKVLSEFAQHKLRILYLCERLGVTRGSFYHHFESIEDYIEQLMQAWEESNTQALIQRANQGSSAKEKLDLLNEQVIEILQTVEAAIRSWSFYHPVVKQHLQTVDRLRLHYLKDLFTQLGYPETKADHLAKLEYASLIGMQQLFPDIQPEELKALYELHIQAYSSLSPDSV